MIAVLWFDLMFDLRARQADVAGYYRHVTSGARPMNRLVGLVMLSVLAAIAAQIADGDGWKGWVSLALAVTAFGIAGGRTFGAARRLGEDPGLAPSIKRDHLVCLGLMTALLVVQLAG